ncbi:MAG: hypothetical protein IT430_19975 [Phycisphaerales bacterium]|nr:hypothetical protein [Phycisphaerales bacterium]
MPRITLAQLARARFADLRAKTRSVIPQRASPHRGYDARWRADAIRQPQRAHSEPGPRNPSVYGVGTV